MDTTQTGAATKRRSRFLNAAKWPFTTVLGLFFLTLVFQAFMGGEKAFMNYIAGALVAGGLIYLKYSEGINLEQRRDEYVRKTGNDISLTQAARLRQDWKEELGRGE